MTLRDYIQNEIFAKRVAEHQVLVIHDSSRRYRDLALGLQGARCLVLDASASVIQARERAVEALADLAAGKVDQVVVWTPSRVPVDEEQKQKDPFSFLGELGSRFPNGDGDDYADLCRRAKPDHVAEVNRLFAEGEPSFEMVDALDQGGSWPKLKTLLEVESAREILVALLAPDTEQETALKQDATWVAEAREFITKSLGHRLKTKGQLRESLADELWPLLLFSEFVFDCPVDLPPSLNTVPRAGGEARNLVFDVCEHLRKHADHRDTYLAKAGEVERDLHLAERCAELTHLGKKDTFAFEERLYLRQFSRYAAEAKHDQAKAIWEGRRHSVWLHVADRQAEWDLALAAMRLMECAQSLEKSRFDSLDAIITFYADKGWEVDRHQRELEQECQRQESDAPGLADLIRQAREWYLTAVEELQKEFVRLVETQGWPARGGNRLCNNQVFDREVDPHLQAGERVAYFLVDSLRLELGQELQKPLTSRGRVSFQAVCAQLPTYTEVGMASLMPSADKHLHLVAKDGKLVTTLGGETTTTPATRLAFLKSRKGDLALDVPLEDLVSGRRLKIPDSVRLLVVRTREIDTLAHGSPRQVLGMFPDLMRTVLRGVTKAAELGFQRVVIATDHGFMLVQDQEAGNVALKPRGQWLIEKSRCLLGQGQKDSANVVLPRGELGIPGDFQDYAAPRTLVPYTRGELYYHEGLSLQECVLPCLSLKVEGVVPKSASLAIDLSLTYKHGKTTKITSRRPVVDLAWPLNDLFAEQMQVEVEVEVLDASGATVGHLANTQADSPAPGHLLVRPGAARAVSLRMEESFAGSFSVRILDAKTHALLAELNLQTAYYE